MWKEALEAFKEFEPTFISDVATRLKLREPPLPMWIQDHILSAIRYNCSGGKCYRGVTVVLGVILLTPECLRKAAIRAACRAGWAIESL